MCSLYFWQEYSEGCRVMVGGLGGVVARKRTDTCLPSSVTLKIGKVLVGKRDCFSGLSQLSPYPLSPFCYVSLTHQASP